MTTLTRSTAICLVLAALAGCEPAAQPGDRPPITKASNWDMVIHMDPETGCQYLRLMNSGRELTPRIAADGKTHMGCKGAQP